MVMHEAPSPRIKTRSRGNSAPDFLSNQRRKFGKGLRVITTFAKLHVLLSDTRSSHRCGCRVFQRDQSESRPCRCSGSRDCPSSHLDHMSSARSARWELQSLGRQVPPSPAQRLCALQRLKWVPAKSVSCLTAYNTLEEPESWQPQSPRHCHHGQRHRSPASHHCTPAHWL